HWLNVQKVIHDALSPLGLNIRMVSHSDEVNVIQKNIIQNLFMDDIIICDVSSRNPNVMFELGVRLTFDKPVVLIKDHDTPISFDIGNIYHITYPRSLNYAEILVFQKELLDKVIATMEKAKGEGYSPFLQGFSIPVKNKGSIETKEVDSNEYYAIQLNEINEKLNKVIARAGEGELGHLRGNSTNMWLDVTKNLVTLRNEPQRRIVLYARNIVREAMTLPETERNKRDLEIFIRSYAIKNKLELNNSEVETLVSLVLSEMGK
ncbi:hypothetical protein, partial [Aeromonas sp. HMWF015]|uniref:hypothetical protein n=1 Tax=Aeromonas sp. HMWF015 TaxID=2056851 RepID=UPI001C6398D6